LKSEYAAPGLLAQARSWRLRCENKNLEEPIKSGSVYPRK
jgi:hypothetical protein